MSFRDAASFLLLLVFALQMARASLFRYLSRPVERQDPRRSRLLRRLFPGLARRADEARAATEPRLLPIERRRTYRSSLRVLLRHDRDLLVALGQSILLVLYLVFVVRDEWLLGLAPWPWGLAVVGAFALLGFVATRREAAALLAQLHVVDERLVRSGRPGRLWPLLAALPERLSGTLSLSMQALAVLVTGPLVTWDNLRLGRVSLLSWTLLGTAALVLLTFDTFHRARLDLLGTFEEAEAQLPTPPPSPESAAGVASPAWREDGAARPSVPSPLV